MQKIGAVELFAVGLHHGDSVLTSFKDLHLINRLQPAPGEVSLSGDEHGVLHTLDSHSLIQISVLKEYQYQDRIIYCNKKCSFQNSTSRLP